MTYFSPISLSFPCLHVTVSDFYVTATFVCLSVNPYRTPNVISVVFAISGFCAIFEHFSDSGQKNSPQTVLLRIPDNAPLYASSTHPAVGPREQGAVLPPFMSVSISSFFFSFSFPPSSLTRSSTINPTIQHSVWHSKRLHHPLCTERAIDWLFTKGPPHTWMQAFVLTQIQNMETLVQAAQPQSSMTSYFQVIYQLKLHDFAKIIGGRPQTWRSPESAPGSEAPSNRLCRGSNKWNGTPNCLNVWLDQCRGCGRGKEA